MSQIATFFVPTALPNTAGAVARASGGSANGGEGFAGILAQFQNILQQAGGQTPANGGQVASLQNPQLIAQLSAVLTQSGAALSTDDLAAQLQAIAGTANGEALPPQFQALLGLLNAGGTGPADAGNAAAEADPALSEQFAALLAALQSITGPASAPTDPNASAGQATAATAIALRGTIAPEQTAASKIANTQAAPDPATTTAEDGVVPAELLAAAARARNANTKSNADEKASPAAPKAETSAATPEQQLDPLKAPGRPAVQSTSTQPSGASHAATNAASQIPQQASNGASVPTAQDIVAAPASAQSAPTNAQNISVTVANTPQAGVPLEALAVHIARKFDAGISQFEIRLHPAELGQLDISLSVADDGRVQAVVRAERADTLDMLQRDARSLEQQLRQAGLDVGSNSLSFSLSGGNGQQRHMPFSGWPDFADAQDAAPNMQQASSLYVTVRTSDGIDIRV